MTDAKPQDHTRSIIEIYDEHETVNTDPVFNYLYDFREKCWNMINDALNLTSDEACADIHEIPGINGEIVGNMYTYTGSPVDWLIRSWIGDPERGFTNIHLTPWLDSTTDVPHLGFAIGTVPDVFFYIDLMPRVDIPANKDYLDKYYEPINQIWVDLKNDVSYQAFNPVHLYTRAVLSPVCLSGVVPFEVFKEKIEGAMIKYIEHWLMLIKNAEPKPENEREALKARDEHVRYTIVENDPANPLAERLVGKDLADRLVRILWGGERSEEQ